MSLAKTQTAKRGWPEMERHGETQRPHVGETPNCRAGRGEQASKPREPAKMQWPRPTELARGTGVQPHTGGLAPPFLQGSPLRDHATGLLVTLFGHFHSNPSLARCPNIITTISEERTNSKWPSHCVYVPATGCVHAVWASRRYFV